jgi:hypothetical protein
MIEQIKLGSRPMFYLMPVAPVGADADGKP